MAALKISDLHNAPTLTKIQDKFGVDYVKLADGNWLSSALDIVESKDIVKRRANEIGVSR